MAVSESKPTKTMTTLQEKEELLASCIGEHVTIHIMTDASADVMIKGVLTKRKKQPAKDSHFAADGTMWIVKSGNGFASWVAFQTSALEDWGWKLTCLTIRLPKP